MFKCLETTRFKTQQKQNPVTLELNKPQNISFSQLFDHRALSL